MLKKYILSAAFCGLMLAATPVAAAVSANPQQEYTEVSTQGEQTEAEGDWVGETYIFPTTEASSNGKILTGTKCTMPLSQ